MAESPSYCLDSHEMRCLSVVKPMTFMMAAEFDIFLAATKARDEALCITFPPLQAEYRRALHFCATRFQLQVTQDDGKGPIVVAGKAKLPLLRYVDFLPGLLHLDEILNVAHAKLTRTEPKPKEGQSNNNTFDFDACCADYAQFRDEEPKFEASAFFHTIDLGLPLATMAHLLRFEVAKIASPTDAVKSFQRFTLWNTFDLRWDDEDTKQAAVIVMPSTADVHDIFDKYEDEATDDEATVLFRLRPVAPCAHVPYLEDALIRRLRDQGWDEVRALWEKEPRFVNGVPVVVVGGLATPSSSLNELVAPFGKAAIVDASLYIESGPHKRRKLYIQFSTPDAARAALELDGQRIASLPGKPVVRVQVAPPHLSPPRRGHLLASTSNSRSPSPQAERVSPVPEYSPKPGEEKKGRNRRDSEKRKERGGQSPPPAISPARTKEPQQQQHEQAPANEAHNRKTEKGASPGAKPAKASSRSPQQASTHPPATHDESMPSRAMNGGKAPSAGNLKLPQARPERGMGSTQHTSESIDPMERQSTGKPEVNNDSLTSQPSAASIKLNTNATPFVPSRSSPGMSFAGAPPPPPYMSPGVGAAAPPPYVPPPPAYMAMMPGITGAPPPPPYVSPPAYASAAPMPPPPPYMAAAGGSPQVTSMPPPPYGMTPQGSEDRSHS
jgi:hypothetical protein